MAKIITNIPLGGMNYTMKFDTKKYYVGSSLSDNGSSSWGDSQLMYLLNGNNYVYSSKRGSTPLYQEYTLENGSIKVRGNYIYQFGGSFLEGSSDGYIPVNSPLSVWGINNSAKVPFRGASVPNSLSTYAQGMVEEVNWKLGGFHSARNDGNAKVFYYSERGMEDNKDLMIWTGKVGLIYPSDMGYATGGWSNSLRSQCLSYSFKDWMNTSNVNHYSDCYENNWLLYLNANNTSKGISKHQCTITPNTLISDQIYATLTADWINSWDINNLYSVRPTLYLKASTQYCGGTGSYDNPIRLC